VAGTEIIARRRKWTAEQKAALLAEVEAEGGHVARWRGAMVYLRACSTTGARPRGRSDQQVYLSRCSLRRLAWLMG
jgi:hypothetical protein